MFVSSSAVHIASDRKQMHDDNILVCMCFKIYYNQPHKNTLFNALWKILSKLRSILAPIESHTWKADKADRSTGLNELYFVLYWHVAYEYRMKRPFVLGFLALWVFAFMPRWYFTTAVHFKRNTMSGGVLGAWSANVNNRMCLAITTSGRHSVIRVEKYKWL